MKENDIGKVLVITHTYMFLLSSKRGNSAEIEAAIGTYLPTKVHVKRISKLLVSYLTRNLRIYF